MVDPITQMAAMTGWMRQQREKQAPRPGPTMEAWRARIPQDIEQPEHVQQRRPWYEMPSRDELVDMAANMVTPLAGTIENVGAKVLKKAAERSALPRLSALHNTSADKLQKSLDLGGMPVPSIAVVPEHVPFDEFGDITLIGKRSLGDPKQTRVFSDDVYSPRVPEKQYAKPKKDAVAGVFTAMTGKEGDRFSSRMYKSLEDGRFDDAVNDAYGNRELVVAFEKAKGLPPSMSSIPPRGYEKDFYRWVRDQIRPLVGEPRIAVGGKLEPYTLENVARVMRRGVVNKEPTLISGGGNIRATNATKYKSLETMRKDAAARIKPRAETPELKQLNEELGQFAQRFRQYDPQTGRNLTLDGNAAEMLADVPKMGAVAAARKHGYANAPTELLDEAEQFMKRFMDAPANYFESKPPRAVRFDEFAGAVVPEGTPESLVQALRSHGIEVEKYADKLGRPDVVAKLRKALAEGGKETLFAVLASVGMGGAMAKQKQERRGIQPL